MAEVEQQQTQHEENHVSEKAPEANGTTGEEHANGTTNGETKPAETTEQNGNGTAHDAKTEETAATPEGTPSKPKRSGSRVKDFFSHIFKRKPKDENGTNADSPKKEKTKKEKAKKSDKTNGTHKEPAATNGESEQPKPADGDAQKGETDAKAGEEGDALGHKVENNLKIEDCAQAEQVNGHGHEKAADGHVDECHVEKSADEHLGQNGADEKAGEISAEQVGGDAEKRNDEKHDC